MQETKPKLELRREYDLGEYRGTYIGYIAEKNIDLHVFLIKDKGEKLYALYNDRWICELEGTITHNLYAPFEPEIFHERNLIKGHPNLSILIKTLEEKL